MKRQTVSAPNHRLRLERELRGWSQQEVAKRIGAPKSFYISRWECGKTLPSPYYREKLCLLFGKNAVELGLLPEYQERSATSPIKSSPNWLVPYQRNPFFTGRGHVLETIHGFLQTKQSVLSTQSVALYGLGGVGKTQTAVEYAYHYAQEYTSVFWVMAETEESICASIMQLADLLGLPERQQANQSRVISAVERWLSTHPRWLMIWDNVEDTELFIRFLPRVREGANLLTTRRRTLGTLVHGLELLPLSREEGMLFLLSRARVMNLGASHEQLEDLARLSPQEYVGARIIAETLEGLPLALDQASAYIEETGCSMMEYLQRYHEQRKLVLARRGTHAGAHADSVSMTLKLSIAQVEREHAAAVDLLRCCAFLHPEAIPEDLLRAGALHLEYTLASITTNPYQFDLALASLRNASLITRHPETQTLSMHRLVQAVLQDQMEQTEIHAWSERVIRMVNTAFPEGEFENWVQCERYLPHALACLSLIEAAGRNLLEGGELLYKVGQYLVKRGRFREADLLLEQAMVLEEQQQEPDHLAMISRLKTRAELFWRQGKYLEGEQLLQRALTCGERHLEPTHPLMIEVLNNLAILYAEQGKYEQVEPLLQLVLSTREHLLGPEHSLTSCSLNNLALFYEKQGKYEQAEPLFQRVLKIEECTHGTEHPRVANVLEGLADFYTHQRQYKQAKPLYKRSLRIREQALGREHPLIAPLLEGLANLYTKQEEYTQAEALYQRALHIREQQWGSEHPETAAILTNLAKLHSNLGEIRKSEAASTTFHQIPDQFQAFLAACCELHPRAWSQAGKLWRTYEWWAEEQQERYPLSRRAFTECLKELGCYADRTNTARIWRGIAVLSKEP